MLKQKTSYHFYYALRPNVRGPLTVWPYRIGPRCSSAYAFFHIPALYNSLYTIIGTRHVEFYEFIGTELLPLRVYREKLWQH